MKEIQGQVEQDSSPQTVFPKTPNHRSIPWWAVMLLSVLIFFLSAGIRLAFFQHVDPYPSPDAMEYVNIARHIAAGDGLLISIKWHLVNDRPVVRSTVGDRAFFYGLVVAAGLRLFPKADDVLVARGVTLIISSFAVVLCMWLFAHLFGWPVGFAAALLAALNPRMIMSGVQPLSDQLFLFLTVAALLIFCLQKKKWPGEAWPPLLCGAVCALAQFTRPVGFLLLLAIVIAYIWEKRPRQLLLLLAGFAIVFLPYAYLNYQENGSPLCNVQAYNYTVFDTREGTWHGLDYKRIGTVEFISRQPAKIASLIIQKTQANARLWYGEIGLPILLALLWPRGWFAGRRKAVLFAALFTFFIYSVSWASPASGRYLLAAFILPLPFLLEAAARPRWVWLRKIGPLLLFVAFAYTASVCVQRDQAYYDSWVRGRKTAADYAAYEYAADWVEKAASRNAVVATNNPWMLNYLTQRPAIICPVFSREAQVAPFLEEYNVDYIVLFSSGKDKRAAMLNNVAEDTDLVLEQTELVDGLQLLIYRVNGGGEPEKATLGYYPEHPSITSK